MNMATTKIWAVKDNLKRLIDYAGNPEKTVIDDDLWQVIHYSSNKNKTQSEEKIAFITGIACSNDNAYADMMAVKKHFGKTSGNVAYHAYQSFKPGEITPEQCHEIGVKLAKALWSKNYQVLVTTHLDKAHCHNHFVINSVSYTSGKKFDYSKKTYSKMRELSDELCRTQRLSVIEYPIGHTPRNIHIAEKNNEPTKYNLMRQAIDESISMSCHPKDFIWVMKQKGYIVDLNPYHKYATIRSVNDTKNTRLHRLGESYDRENILERIKENDIGIAYSKLKTFSYQNKSKPIHVKRYSLVGSLTKTSKITGLRALYFYYCYLLGYMPKKKSHKPLSPEMRQACRKLDRYSKEINLICREKLNSLDDVQNFIFTSKKEICLLENERQHIYNKLRRCTDPEIKSELLSKRDSYTSALKLLRKDVRTANNILTDNREIKENIEAEKTIQQQKIIIKSKQRPRYQNYER